MHPIEACVRNPVKVAVGVLMVALFGVISLILMPMQLTPEVQTPTITIDVRWLGASPHEVEKELVNEMEEFLKSVEGLTKMSSESTDSAGKITLEFLVGTNMEEALLKVNTRLQQVRKWPENADRPVISTSNSSDRPIAWFILSPRRPSQEKTDQFLAEHPDLTDALQPVLTTQNPGLAIYRLQQLAKAHPEVKELLPPPEVDVTKLRRFAEDVIEARFERVSGVSNSNVMGGLEEELQVVVSGEKLAARQLTIADVRNVLLAENKDTSAGDLWEGKRRWVVRVLGQFRSPQQVAGVLLARRDGNPVYVRDVAEVRLGYKKPDGMVRRFGSSSVAINAQRETGANVLDVMDGLRKATAELNEGVLADMNLELTQVYDETEYIDSSVGLVNQSLVIGGLLTVLVLLLFLRSGRSTLVIALAIPTSLIGTFLVLFLLGRSLNVISLAGLAFAVGMLVDNAVVVLENIFRRHQMGEPPFTAAIRGAKEVWGAIVASTLTTLAVFLPVLFVQQEAGQLFRDIALAISAAVGLSLLVSITVIPTATARLFKEHESQPQPEPIAPHVHSAGGNGNGDGEVTWSELSGGRSQSPKGSSGRLNWLFEPLDRFGAWFVETVVGINAWLLAGVGRRLAVVGVLVGLTAVISYLLRPKVEYLPSGNRNLVFGIVMPPPGYNINQLAEMGSTVEKELEPYWNVDPDSEEAKNLPNPVIGDFFFVARGRQVFIGLRAADPAEASKLPELIQSVTGKLPGTFAVAKQSSLFERGLTAGRTIDVEITGPELETLVQMGGQVMGKVSQLIPRAQARPVPSLDLSSPEVHLHPNYTQAKELGVDTTQLGYAVDALIDGAYAGDYFQGGDKIDLTIIGRESDASRTQDLQALSLNTPTGQLVPLSTLVTTELSSGPEQINRRERLRAITIEVSPPAEMALEDALSIINTQIVQPMRQAGQLTGGYAINLSGTADKLNETWDALKWNVILALLITYLLMAALFESWAYPLVIILSVPLGAVGGIVGLQLLNVYLYFLGSTPQTLDVLTMLGFVILIGTVVNNPILIVHQSINHMREDGMLSGEAILASIRTRIRPIFMTTTTTVLGLSPLVFFPGAGSELYRGLGAVVLGGLVVSTVFTLVLVPTLFSLTMEVKAWLAGRRRPESQPKAVLAVPPEGLPARPR